MPKSTTTPNRRTQKLIDECLVAATVLGRFPSGAKPEEVAARSAAVAAFRARLAGLTLPQLEREHGQLELERRRRYTATTDTLVRSAGPRAVTAFLRDVGLMVFMQRMDLLEVVLNGWLFPEPLHARVLEIVEAEGVTDEMLTPQKAAETVQTMRAIACAVCVQPPEEYLTDPDFDPEAVDPHLCPRQFVMPGGPCGPGQLPIYVPELEPRADGWRGLGRKDLRALARAAIDNGPGALMAFRLRQESLVADVPDGEGHDDAAERATGDHLPVGGDRPRPRGKRVRAVGRGQDG